MEVPDSLDELTHEAGISHKKLVPIPPSYEKIAAAAASYAAAQDRLLYQWLYLTGQRISEAIETRRSDVSKRVVDGKEFLVVDSVTLKNKHRPRRDISIPLFGLEQEMSGSVWAAIENQKPETKINYFSRQTAFNHLSKVQIPCNFFNTATKERLYDRPLAIYPHFLRHCRASHLAIEHEYDLRKLMDFFGWASPTMPNLYASTSWRDLAKGFIHA